MPSSTQASGAFQCDLSQRSREEASIYSAKLHESVCECCGHVELYSESHRDLCSC
jgi:hypothetical protein